MAFYIKFAKEVSVRNMIDEELIEKYKDHNIFIGDIVRTPKVKKVSKGKLHYRGGL